MSGLSGLWRGGCVVMIGLWLSGCALAGAPDEARVAAAIRQHYEQALPGLPMDAQRHYAQRLYRLTGDERYLPLLQAHAERLLAGLREDIEGLSRPGYAALRAREILNGYGDGSARQRQRKQMLGEWGEIAFAKRLAFRLSQARAYGLLDERHLPGHRRALDYLASLDFRRFVTAPEVIEVYAAQVANLAYYLHGLGVVDLRQAAVEAFRAHYPPRRDAELSRASYRNKIYGMTHFMIAASDYYQRPLAEEEFDDMLDYFAAHLDRILAETKEDIYIEVGICFLLAGREADPVVARLRRALVGAYDAGARMIPAEHGGRDLARGEHRNVLAIMLLDWPERLTPGPDLSAALSAEQREAVGIDP